MRVIILGVVTLLAATAWSAEDRSWTIQERMSHRGLTQSIEGALIYLADTQIKVHPGRHSPSYSSCRNHGCLPTFPINIKLLRRLPGAPAFPPFPPVQNNEGEWASSIHIFPGELGNRDGETFVSILDSNMFVTASLIYPMFLFRDETAEGEVGSLLAQAMTSILAYQRGDGFSFWPQQLSANGDYPIVKPYNVPLLKENLQLMGFSLRFVKSNSVQMQWNRMYADPQINPWGVESLANIPNDADDTALALASIYLYQQLMPPAFANEQIVQKAAEFARMGDEFSRYRDVGARREDGRDSWKGSASGAFLTWLKPDAWGSAGFAQPATGVMPLGVNNVDCVVNANVMYALGLRGDKQAAGFAQTIDLVAKAIDTKAWPKCGLYYPQNMIFPYTASRAYREGHIDDIRMEAAMAKLAQDLIADQAAVKRQIPRQSGAFSGGADKSYHLATALAVSALLNIGADVAEKYGFLASYEHAVHDGVAYLIRERIRHRVIFGNETLVAGDTATGSQPARYGYRWTSGLFFSASMWDLAQWRSEAYTVAIVMEALTKYMLAYDLSQASTLHDLRVTIKQPPYSVDDANRAWQFIVE